MNKQNIQTLTFAGQTADKSIATGQLKVVVISDAAPGRNGVGTFYVDLLQHLHHRFHTLELICPTIEENGKWKAGLVFPLPGDATQKLCMPNPFSLQRSLSEIDPDVIVLATPGVYGLLGAFLAGRMNVPAIAGFHTSFEEITRLYWSNSAAGRVVHGYFKVSNNYLFKKCQLVLANSEAMMEQARRFNAPAVALIGTVISPLFTEHTVQPYNGELKRVLFAGRLAPEKNIDAIIQAAEALPHLQFTFAGDGPLREYVESAAQRLPNIQLLGWLKRESLRDQIDCHDVLVLPSHFESFGTIALEAMARERLVVVSSHCGISEWREYTEGLHIMPNGSLEESLSMLENIGEDERKQKARQALETTKMLNESSLRHWCQLLADMAASGVYSGA